MTVEGVAFIGIRVADGDTFAATVSLYRDVMRLAVTRDDGRRSVRFRLTDGSSLHIYGPDDVDHVEFGDRACVGLRVADVDATLEAFRAAAIEILDPEPERDGDEAWFHYRSPDGAIWEILGPDQK